MDCTRHSSVNEYTSDAVVKDNTRKQEEIEIKSVCVATMCRLDVISKTRHIRLSVKRNGGHHSVVLNVSWSTKKAQHDDNAPGHNR